MNVQTLRDERVMLCECVLTICEKFVVVFLFFGLFFGNEHHKPTREEKNEKKAGTWRSIQREGEKKSFFFPAVRGTRKISVLLTQPFPKVINSPHSTNT